MIGFTMNWIFIIVVIVCFAFAGHFFWQAYQIYYHNRTELILDPQGLKVANPEFIAGRFSFARLIGGIGYLSIPLSIFALHLPMEKWVIPAVIVVWGYMFWVGLIFKKHRSLYLTNHSSGRR